MRLKQKRPFLNKISIKANLWLVGLLFFALILPTKVFAQYVASSFLSAEAASAFNQGMSLLKANHNEEAAAKFQYVIQVAASYGQAYYEYGVALMKLGRFDQAISQFTKAIKFQPSVSADWLALGSAYQLAGQVEQAIATYKDFIGRFPHNENVPRVQKLISSLNKSKAADSDNGDQDDLSQTNPGGINSKQSNRKQTNFDPSNVRLSGLNQLLSKEFDSQPADTVEQTTANVAKNVNMPHSLSNDDYYADMTRQGVLCWPTSRMPIRILIEKGDLVPGYRPVFSTILRNAFIGWADASNGLLSITFVIDPAQADITCRWTDNTLKFQDRTESGETRLYSDRFGVARGEVEILTIPAPRVLLTDKHMQRLALHEAGHALALTGHTKNPDDAMFYSTAANIDTWKAISPRDRRTIVHLYSIRR